jgi:hypothetical protein
VPHNFIAQVWRDHDLQPQRQDTFKLSNDPDFEAKVADVVGLYLDSQWVRWCCRSPRYRSLATRARTPVGPIAADAGRIAKTARMQEPADR